MAITKADCAAWDPVYAGGGVAFLWTWFAAALVVALGVGLQTAAALRHIRAAAAVAAARTAEQQWQQSTREEVAIDDDPGSGCHTVDVPEDAAWRSGGSRRRGGGAAHAAGALPRAPLDEADPAPALIPVQAETERARRVAHSLSRSAPVSGRLRPKLAPPAAAAPAVVAAAAQAAALTTSSNNSISGRNAGGEACVVSNPIATGRRPPGGGRQQEPPPSR